MPSKLGNEILVNTVTAGSQLYPSVSPLSNGNFVVTWQIGAGSGISAQIFDAAGAKIGTEFKVSMYNNGFSPSVCSLDNGNFVVAWAATALALDPDGSGISAQIFDSSGTKVGTEFLVNNFTTGSQSSPSITDLKNGNFIVTWESQGQDVSGTYGIYGQIFSSSGQKVGSEIRINTVGVDDQLSPSVALLKDGNFVVTWQSITQDGTAQNIYAQIFAPSGAKIGTEYLINTFTAGVQLNPSIASLNDGNFVITWESNGQDSSMYGIYGQIFSPSGTKIGTEFIVNTYVTNNQQFSSISSLKNGNFIVTWASTGQDGNLGGIYGQVFNASGTKIGSEFLVNTYTTDNQNYPSVTSLNNGNFIVSWMSNNQDTSGGGIYAQIFYGQTVLNSASQNLTYTEDTARSINTLSILGALNEENITAKLILSDPSAGNFNTTTSGSATSTYNTNTGVWQAAGNITEVNSLLNGVVFTPSSNYDKNFTVSVEVTDNINPQVNGTLSMQAVSMNDVPVIINNRLSVTQGDSVIVTTADLSATDVETSNNSLTFHLNGVQHGRFEKVSSPGVSISSFTQQEIINGQIRFVHDGSTFSPAYEVFVRDEAGSTSSAQSANISFMELPSVPTPIGSPAPSPSPTSVTTSSVPVPASTPSAPGIVPEPFNLTTSTSSIVPLSPTPSSTPAPGEGPKAIGAIVGGVVGVAALLTGIGIFWCGYRQKVINGGCCNNEEDNGNAMKQNQPHSVNRVPSNSNSGSQ